MEKRELERLVKEYADATEACKKLILQSMSDEKRGEQMLAPVGAVEINEAWDRVEAKYKAMHDGLIQYIENRGG